MESLTNWVDRRAEILSTSLGQQLEEQFFAEVMEECTKMDARLPNLSALTDQISH